MTGWKILGNLGIASSFPLNIGKRICEYPPSKTLGVHFFSIFRFSFAEDYQQSAFFWSMQTILLTSVLKALPIVLHLNLCAQSIKPVFFIYSQRTGCWPKEAAYFTFLGKINLVGHFIIWEFCIHLSSIYAFLWWVKHCEHVWSTGR